MRYAIGGTLDKTGKQTSSTIYGLFERFEVGQIIKYADGRKFIVTELVTECIVNIRPATWLECRTPREVALFTLLVIVALTAGAFWLARSGV